MARNDGVDRTTVRHMRLNKDKIINAEHHNERQKENYVNQDIVPERTSLNVHYKQPSSRYSDMFEQMVKEGIISTRGLKPDADTYGELIFDVNSAYFHNHGGYEYAKRFFEEAYKAAIQIVGGEQYIFSAVMPLSAFLCCIAARRFLRSNLSSVLLISLLGPTILDVLRLLLLVFLEKASVRSLWITTLPAALLSFLISVPAIVALFLIHRKLNLVFHR